MKQENITETWYSFVDWTGEFVEIVDVKQAREALRNGFKVIKNTRTIYDTGPTNVKVSTATEVTKVKDL